MRSATTAEAVGPAPAPLPSSITRPTKSPSATTALNTPSTLASGEACGTMQGCTRASIPLLGLARDAEQLDAVAELVGEGDVERGDAADALDMHRLERNRPAEGERREDRQLVRGVDAVDVEGRVGFRVAELLRVGQHFGELAPALAHDGQDVVAGAVEDAGDADDAVRRQVPRAAP